MVSTRNILGYSVGHIKESGLLKEGMHSKLRGRAGHFLCVLAEAILVLMLPLSHK